MDVDLSTRAWTTYRDYTLKENWPFIPQKSSIVNSPSFRSGGLWVPYPFPLQAGWNVDWFDLVQAAVTTMSSWMQCSEDTVLLQSSCGPNLLFTASSMMLAKLLGKGHNINVPLMEEPTTNAHALHFEKPWVSELLSIAQRNSLRRFESYRDLWIER